MIWKVAAVVFALSTAVTLVLWHSRPNPLESELRFHCEDLSQNVRWVQAALHRPDFSKSPTVVTTFGPRLDVDMLAAMYREALFCASIHRADDETRARWEGPTLGVAAQTVDEALIHIDVYHADDPALRSRAADALDPMIALIDEINASPLR